MSITSSIPRHLISIANLSNDQIRIILDKADKARDFNYKKVKSLDDLAGRTVVTLFLEPSTRTRSSFEIAAKRLGADVINFSAASSATVKGESLLDTIETLNAMSVDFIIIRHAYAGSAQIVADCVDKAQDTFSESACHVINAGDGKHEHPTQTLLDLHTMRAKFGTLQGLKVGIVGDLAHSRVAGSLAPALIRQGAHVTMVAPPTLTPSGINEVLPEVTLTTKLNEIIGDLDVLYLLRIQTERLKGQNFPSLGEYRKLFGVDIARAKLLSPSAYIMHPGPINRGIELSKEVTDKYPNLILDQVANGVAVRMALLQLMA